ncbi:hypothetical protein CSAL01_13059 [Colletotrichum salicis]|uniref:Uncharacterized protein n=1 Tax=Colletotrichum salicis TaxID=1209931 RepID=A0A135UXA4_9PEZI|nr:hypothetical protein CSAL01_13059 [Colletotrichum salicis]
MSGRMGRPQRGDKKRRGTDNSPKSRAACSQESSAGVRTLSQTSHQGSTTDGDVWLDNGSEDAMDAVLAGTRYLQSLNFGLHDSNALNDDEVREADPEDLLHVNFDFGVPRTLSDFGIYDSGSEATSDLLEQPAELIPTEPRIIIGNNSAAEKPNIRVILPVSSSSSQKAVERLSGLNVEVHQQLTTEPSLRNPACQRSQISRAVVSMIQGLQAFHELVSEILGAANQDSPGPASRASQKNGGSLQNTVTSYNTPHRPSSISSHKDCDAISLSNTNSEFRHAQDSSPQLAWLDMPTSLLVMSCYSNLIQLCREVFAAIRVVLPVPGHQATLLEFSGFQIGGVAFHEDSDLQIIILTQVVIRLIHRIGPSLGHPGSSTAERGEDSPLSKAIPTQLLDLVMGPEAADGRPSTSCKGQIEALREEIRDLSKIGFKVI